MGNYITRRNGGVEELDLSSNNAFHYPPKSGKFSNNCSILLKLFYFIFIIKYNFLINNVNLTKYLFFIEYLYIYII